MNCLTVQKAMRSNIHQRTVLIRKCYVLSTTLSLAAILTLSSSSDSMIRPDQSGNQTSESSMEIGSTFVLYPSRGSDRGKDQGNELQRYLASLTANYNAVWNKYAATNMSAKDPYESDDDYKHRLSIHEQTVASERQAQLSDATASIITEFTVHLKNVKSRYDANNSMVLFDFDRPGPMGGTGAVLSCNSPYYVQDGEILPLVRSVSPYSDTLLSLGHAKEIERDVARQYNVHNRSGEVFIYFSVSPIKHEGVVKANLKVKKAIWLLDGKVLYLK